MTHFLLILVILLTSSCATVLNGTKEKIHLRSTIPGARFYLGEQFLGTNEVSTYVRKKDLKRVRLFAKKDGCETAESKIETQFDSTTLFGLLVDLGIISILIVDWAIYGTVTEAERTGYVLNPKCPSPEVLPAGSGNSK